MASRALADAPVLGTIAGDSGGSPRGRPGTKDSLKIRFLNYVVKSDIFLDMK